MSGGIRNSRVNSNMSDVGSRLTAMQKRLSNGEEPAEVKVKENR